MVMAIPMLSPLLYELQKWEIKSYMSRLLKEERTLQTVCVPEQDVVWMDKHEIWINEQMFDIVSVKLQDGIYRFTGLYDEGETQVVKKQMLGGKDTAQHKKRISLMIKWLTTYCLLESVNTTSPMQGQVHLYAAFTASLQIAFSKVSIPPPRRLTYHIT
jgi:hypothetical protein